MPQNLFLLPYKKELFPLLKEFCLPYEHTCVELISTLKKDDSYFFLITSTSSQEEITNKNQIKGFFHISRSLLFCIPNIQELFPSLTDFSSFLNPHKHIFTKFPLHIVAGQKNQSLYFLYFLKTLQRIPFQTIDYHLLTINEPPLPPPEPLSCDTYIKCCTKADLDDLMDLQKNFLIKEVITKDQKITNTSVNLILSQMLKCQVVMAVVNDNDFVAKANTNAIGFEWVQLGGVYTHPLYRNNYYAWNLIYNLVLRIQKNQKKTCLFVKERNTPAINLYKHLGFLENDKFLITYF